MYTGYFSKLKTYTSKDLIPVSIALFTPKWYRGVTYLSLAPSYNLFKRYKYDSISLNEYIIEYNLQISKLDPIKVRKDLMSISNNLEKIILLCYEKPTEFCHRKLAADWLCRNRIISFYKEFVL